MNNSMLVRASRDGDQFHYLWAARRCLGLLLPGSELVVVTIEGASPDESQTQEPIEAGEELIDLAEYYGDEDVIKASLIRYIQVKHSTLHASESWVPSGLEKTLTGFAERYKKLIQIPNIGELNGKLEFWFVSNRPINTNFLEAIEDAANEAAARHPIDLKKLEKFTNLSGFSLSAFCKLLHLKGNHDGYLEQRSLLFNELGGYLPGSDRDSPAQLKELITRKALTESAANPRITKYDVLRALGADEDGLFPANCQIEQLEKVIPREQEAEIVEEIIKAENQPVVIHAAGGVGKSIISTRLKTGLPEGSICILYDCFGNGLYRNPSSYRHRPKDALVQIANELAGQGFCHPLIPSPHADSTHYFKAFLHRLNQSIEKLKLEHPEALLCIVIDAADNAQMAAEEIGENKSFARDLLREKMPVGIRIVMLCRTERQHLLNPPTTIIAKELLPFSVTETERHLRQKFTEATTEDVNEFHRLSSHNPRVQATALAQKITLSEILRSLGPNPTTVEDTIKHLFEQAVTKLRDNASSTEKEQIDLICVGLAILRPLIPISVLALISRTNAAAIRSFAVDFGRPLRITGETIQFFDEPVETWFQNTYKPEADQLKAFIDLLKPLTIKSPYIASVLPQMMLEAGQFSELVDLALSSEGLPEDSPIERRDIELQRLQFALKACLREKRYTDAAKIALKAGGETAGEERQQRLIQENTDLAAQFMDINTIQETVSRKTFGGSWLGVHHVYEAGLLSTHRDLHPDARSRLRMAHEWLVNWSRLSKEERQKERIEIEDIAEMAMAHLKIHDPDYCANDLRGWQPRETAFNAGRIIASRLIDQEQYEDLDRLAFSAGNNVYLILAITLELRTIHRLPPKEVVERALRLILNKRVNIQIHDRSYNQTTLRAITALVEAGIQYSLCTKEQFASLLARYLPDSPPRDISFRYERQGRFTLLRAYTLQAVLTGKELELIDLAYSELRSEFEKSDYSSSSELRNFKETIGVLLPWHHLWAKIFIGDIQSDEIKLAIETVRSKSSNTRISYVDENYASDEVAKIWFYVLALANNITIEQIDDLNKWISSPKRPIFTPTFILFSRVSAHSGSNLFRSKALHYASIAFERTKDAKEDAEEKAKTFISLARAVLTLNRYEAEEYFHQAVAVASKIGDENLDRWGALLALADRTKNPSKPNSEMAYKLARCAELTRSYVDRDKHFPWKSTVQAIAHLCPSSALAIASRWRDRGFGWYKRILPTVIDTLLEDRKIDPAKVLPLLCLNAEWDSIHLIKVTLGSLRSKAEKEKAIGFFYHYAQLEDENLSFWQSLKEITGLHNLTLADIENWILFSEKKHTAYQKSQEAHHSYPSSDSKKDKKDWDKVFFEVELDTSKGIQTAFNRFLNTEPPFYRECFFTEASKRVPSGREVEFIKSVFDIPDFKLYEFQSFVRQALVEWENLLSVRSEMIKSIKTIFRDQPIESSTSYYSSFCGLLNIPEKELTEVVLQVYGETSESINTTGLFTIIRLLALQLSDVEALEALSFGLGLLEVVIEDTEGDGPWSALLEPPKDPEVSLVGYIWSALAAPEASLRWEAAHAVRALCHLGHETLLSNLINLAKSKEDKVFRDSRLYFYRYHAIQWLLIALARTALESPSLLVAHIDFFINLALNGEPHVLIRGYSAKAGLRLFDSGQLPVDTEMQQKLAEVNTSKLEPKVSKKQRLAKRPDKESKKGRFYFGIDIGPYWFASLGNCFGLSMPDIEREAEKVIIEEWEYTDTGDERSKRNIYEYKDTAHSHGSYPRTDNLQFYLSYHAMMLVAGKLLSTKPLVSGSDFFDATFEDWLLRHSLTRRDGKWLADRRDSMPFDWPEWKDQKQEKNVWRWSLRREDFRKCLELSTDMINLWGRWNTKQGDFRETVSIHSALVSPSNSEALLRALQTASNPHDFRIPDANDDLQITHGEFQLKGWLINDDSSKKHDEYDPWAGSIYFPPLAPAQLVIDMLCLESDSENRTWHVQGNNRILLRSQLWGQYQSRDSEHEGESGRRIQASHDFILELTQKSNMDLIIEVEIERRINRPHYESYQGDDFGFLPPSTRLFLIKQDGKFYEF